MIQPDAIPSGGKPEGDRASHNTGTPQMTTLEDDRRLVERARSAAQDHANIGDLLTAALIDRLSDRLEALSSGREGLGLSQTSHSSAVSGADGPYPGRPEGQSFAGWRRISVELPPADGLSVILGNPLWEEVVACEWSRPARRDADLEDWLFGPTHWCRLPPPAESGADGSQRSEAAISSTDDLPSPDSGGK